METKDIINRVVHLLEPNLSNITSTLSNSEIDYFIHDIVKGISNSLYNWELKTNGK